MVSHLGIRPGDPATLLLLARNEPEVLGDARWPTSRWAPVGLPFFGAYDGAGGLTDVPADEAGAFTLSYLADRGCEGIDLSTALSERITAARIEVDGRERPLARAFLHRRVWTFLTEAFTFEVWDNAANCAVVATGSSYLRAAFERMASAEAGIADTIAYYRSLGVTDVQAAMIASAMASGAPNARDEIRGGEGEIMPGGEALWESNRPLFLEAYTKLLTLRTALMFLRRSFEPASAIGEADTPARRYEDFLKVCQELIVDQKADEILRQTAPQP